MTFPPDTRASLTVAFVLWVTSPSLPDLAIVDVQANLTSSGLLSFSLFVVNRGFADANASVLNVLVDNIQSKQYTLNAIHPGSKRYFAVSNLLLNDKPHSLSFTVSPAQGNDAAPADNRVDLLLSRG